MTTVDITTVPLAPWDFGDLVMYEARIEKAIEFARQNFVQAGECLDQIRDRRLYRQTHDTFAAYVEDRFGITVNYAYRMISATKVAKVVLPIGNIKSEAVARELVGLSDEQVIEVYQAAVEIAPKPTAAVVKKVRQETIAPVAERRPLARNRSELISAYSSRVRRVRDAAMALRDLHQDALFHDQVAPLLRDTRTALGGYLTEVLVLMQDIAGDAYSAGDR